MFGVKDNTCSNIWISTGGARRGVGLILTRTSHLWLIRVNFRFSFQRMPGRNFSADFLSGGGTHQIDDRARANGMTCIDSRAAWGQFLSTIPSHRADWHTGTNPPIIVRGDLRASNWHTGAFFRIRDALGDVIPCPRIDPRRSRTGRLVSRDGVAEHCSIAIHFTGGLAEDSIEALQFASKPKWNGA